MKRAALILLGGLLAFQVLQIARAKVRQHILVLPLAPLAQQGETLGKVSAVVDIKAAPNSELFTLSALSSGYFIQRFSREFIVEAGHLFGPKEKPLFKDLVALTPLPDSKLLVAERGGRVLRLDRDFRPESEFKLDLNEIKAMCLSMDSKLWVLDGLAHHVLVFGQDGSAQAPFGLKKLLRPRSLAVTGKGRAVVLDQVGEGFVLKVFSRDGRFERAIQVANVTPSPTSALGAGADELVALNDGAGVRGVLFFDVEKGHFHGETLGAEGSGEPMIHPGFAAGDPWSGIFYLHFGPGLLKCALPAD